MDRGKIADTTEAERIQRCGARWHELDMEQETHEIMRARGCSFVEEMASRFAGQEILAVTHGYILGQTLKELMCDESTGVKLRNTSVTTIAWRASHGRIRFITASSIWMNKRVRACRNGEALVLMLPNSPSALLLPGCPGQVRYAL